jgi:hypothetical protein
MVERLVKVHCDGNCNGEPNSQIRIRLGWLRRGKPSIGNGDIKPLFDLAKQFEEEILRLQSDETTKSVAEFSSSVALLGELIKSQLEYSEEAAACARAAFETQQKGAQKGAVEVKIIHKAAPVKVDIAIDSEGPERFLGLSWAKTDLPPGQHTLFIGPHGAKGPQTQQVVVIPPGGVAKTEVSILEEQFTVR